jgi:Protein of unknown function (DUF2809)
MLTFKFRYFVCALLIFFIEVFIALFIHDGIIRPYIGDILVVILIYCFLRSFLNLSVWTLAVITLLFSWLIEVLQYFKIVELLGLQNSKFAQVVMGTSFSWIDILCYTLGFAIVLSAERLIAGK